MIPMNGRAALLEDKRFPADAGPPSVQTIQLHPHGVVCKVGENLPVICASGCQRVSRRRD